MLLSFPPGVTDFMAANGVRYTPDANGQADIPQLFVPDAIGMGFTAGYLHETPAYVASYTPDLKMGNTKQITLSGNITAINAPINAAKGQELIFVFIQDGTGGRTVGGWNSKFKVTWSDAGNTLNKRSTIKFLFDGTNWNQIGAQTPYV